MRFDVPGKAKKQNLHPLDISKKTVLLFKFFLGCCKPTAQVLQTVMLVMALLKCTN